MYTLCSVLINILASFTVEILQYQMIGQKKQTITSENSLNSQYVIGNKKVEI